MKNVLLIFFLLNLVSCEKDSKTTNPSLVGIVNENMYSETFSPNLSLDYTWDDCGYGPGKDSIDLYKDGIYDFKISAKFLDYSAFMICCGNADCLPNGITYSFSSINKVAFATYLVPFNDFNLRYADTLSKGSQLDSISNWNSNTNVWSMDYGNEYSGAWYFSDKDCYLGLRVGDSTDYKYGWVRISTDSDHNLIFKEYAIGK
jgi:hypothetical protein